MRVLKRTATPEGSAKRFGACLLVVPLLFCLRLNTAAQTPARPTDPAAPASAKATVPPGKEQREAQIAADTERLYQLARELKTELDKSTKDTLSLSVIKKADEVEKLAHSLKERLKTQ